MLNLTQNHGAFINHRTAYLSIWTNVLWWQGWIGGINSPVAGKLERWLILKEVHICLPQAFDSSYILPIAFKSIGIHTTVVL